MSFLPLQKDADYLVLALFKARVWMNETRRAREKILREIPRLIEKRRRRA